MNQDLFRKYLQFRIKIDLNNFITLIKTSNKSKPMKKFYLLFLVAFIFSCTSASPCDDNYFPVCGINGKTYGNECFAGIDGITIYTDGECSNN